MLGTPVKDRVAKHRERKRQEKMITQAGVTAAPEMIKEAASAIVTARKTAESTAEQTATLGDAFGAGMAAAMFRAVVDGHTEREHELRDWLARPQPCRWLFLHYLTQQGIYGDFLAWLADSLPGVGD